MKGYRTLLGVGFILGLVVLTGCAWTGAVGLVSAVVLLLVLLVGCGGQTLSDEPGVGDTDGGSNEDAASDALSEASPDTASDTTRDALPDVAPVQDSGPIGCGGGYCPTGMTCVLTSNGAWCLPDADMDDVLDEPDNCPFATNDGQLDGDEDGVGDACDLCVGPNDSTSCGEECCSDPDGDTVPGQDIYGGFNGFDNCPYVPNVDQADWDQDGVGDACDLCPEEFNPLSPCGDPCLDSDGDGVADMGFCGEGDTDTCPFTPSEHQADTDGDQTGDVCDPDGIAPLSSAADFAGYRRELLERLMRQGVLKPETVGVALSAMG